MAKSFDILKYYRLYGEDGSVVGFKRIITEKGSTKTVEYLKIGEGFWKTASIKHNPDNTIALSAPPAGIENLRRSKTK